jgi:hypothetical protein
VTPTWTYARKMGQPTPQGRPATKGLVKPA